MPLSRPENLVRGYILLALAEGLGALLWLLLIPSNQAVLFAGRLILITPLLFLIAALAWLAFSLWRKPERAERLAQGLYRLSCNAFLYWTVLALAGAAVAGCASFLIISARTIDPYVRAYLERLAPYAAWGFLAAAQTLFALRLLRHGKNMEVFKPYRKTFLTCGLVFAILLTISALVLWSRIGLKPDEVGWGTPGTPILPFHVLIALGITLACLGAVFLVTSLWRRLIPRPTRRLDARVVDALICLFLWLGAFAMWSREPLKPSYFAPKPVPPNQEYYPFSDAAHYDLSAQKLLIGIGFEHNVIRPIYSLYLALAQGVSGIGYQSVLGWQVPILAVIPAVLYLMAKTLHHRITGVLIGLLAIFHETTAINLSGVIDVTHSKMIMSELPTMLGIAILCLFLILWLKDPFSNKIHPFIAGGVLGLTMLVRSQVILLLPAILILAWFPCKKQPLVWLKSSGALLLALVITLAPWFWRNWTASGEGILADPEPSGIVFRFSSLDKTIAPQFANESNEDYADRQRIATNRYIREHPLEIAGVITGHFLNNQISSLLMLPSTLPVLSHLQITPEELQHPGLIRLSIQDLCCTPRSYVKLSAYWDKNWDSHFQVDSGMVIWGSLILLSTGVGIAGMRHSTASLAPLVVGLTYAATSPLARLSGWRFNAPVEWVTILYYCIGLVQACFWVAMIFDNRFIPAGWENQTSTAIPARQEYGRYPWRRSALIGLLFFALAASIPIAERTIPNRYQGMSVQNTLDSLEQAGALQAAGVDMAEINQLLMKENSVSVIGRVLYPRYYEAKKGAPSIKWPSFAPRDYPRLGFYLIPGDLSIVLPLNKPPERFPNGSDVLILGCLREDYVEALMVAILNEPDAEILQLPKEQWSCDSP
jgi:hypothetical protein